MCGRRALLLLAWMWAVACQAPAAAPPPAALAATSGAGGSAVIPIETAGGSGNVQATMPAAGTAGTNTPATTGGAAGEAPQLSRGHGPGSIFELTLEAPERPVQKGQYRLYVPNDV